MTEIKILHEFNCIWDTLLLMGFKIDSNHAIIDIKNKEIVPIFIQLKKLGINKFEITL